MTSKPRTLSRAAALTEAKRRQERLNKSELAATEAAFKRDQAVYDAQQAGATYADIQAATGLSEARVAQVLAKVRDRLAKDQGQATRTGPSARSAN
jgi:hypothetical protein